MDKQLKKLCQSCGMPMVAVDHFGTNSDNSTSEDYCCFCLKDGNFTDGFTLNEFVNDSLQYHNIDEKLDGLTLSKEEYELRNRVKLANLKRWTSHNNTHQEYYKSVNYAIDFVGKHLTDSINLNQLAEVANLSLYHFHRIFKAIMNESPGEYIQRLRLEKACFKLQTSTHPLAVIAEETGYQSLYSLSKAFKKRFGVTPSVFRGSPLKFILPLKKPIENLHLTPEIKSIAPTRVICTKVINPFEEKDAFIRAWNKLTRFVNVDGVPSNEYQYYSISRDFSTLTQAEHYRIYSCISAPEKIKPKGEFSTQTIDGGLYAIFRHKGSYKNLETIYCNIYRYWIPNSEYQLRDTLHFEKYLNSPQQVSEDCLLTEIYIPVKPV